MICIVGDQRKLLKKDLNIKIKPDVFKFVFQKKVKILKKHKIQELRY